MEKYINLREEVMMKEILKKNQPKELKNITRIEVIEKGMRKYTKWDCKVEESIQDEGRTLKLFVEDNKDGR